MSSGSLKDLSKTITASAPDLTLPLPDDLVDVINAYLEKHAVHDDSESQRLQEELFNIYHSSIADTPARLAPFLAILRILKPAIRGAGRLLQWWDKLASDILRHVGVERGLAVETRDILLGILIYDEDEAIVEADAKATSDAVTENLLATWLAKTKVAAEELDEYAKFVEGQIQQILIAYGKRRPKNFLNSLNKFFVKKDTRIATLSLLCEFFRHQPPHLHQLLSTPLFDNLLRCLQIDTSTRVISLAMTALIMLLPHIPRSSAQHLPALFNIYSRMLFWDRERRRAESKPLIPEDEESEKRRQPVGDGKPWDKMLYLLESEDETVPELLHYFTFLYGLYPINFMSYIRKPQRYLRHANFPGADDLDIEPLEIRQRSESFRQVHILHPNFFLLTIESELTDTNRWMKSEAADVVAECMALYVPTDDGQQHKVRPRGPRKNTEMSSDIPDQPLLDDDSATPFQSRHNSWRDTRSTAVASPAPFEAEHHRTLSQTSQSMPSIVDSPSLRASRSLDSPTILPQIIASGSHPQLSNMLGSQVSIRGSIYKTLTNESVASLALSNTHDTTNVDAYLTSLTRESTTQSPSLRPNSIQPIQPDMKIAYLHREIQLLKNDLNFERYLKQQHLSHIGQLRRKQIREARVEAETQNLINSNRGLKSKLEEAKRLNLQIKKETEKSKAHSRKWEGDLTAKLRLIKEEQKKWIVEREVLKRDLEAATEDVKRLKQVVVKSEFRELAAMQKVKGVEASLGELERLRSDVEKMNIMMRTYEAGEIEGTRAKENETRALNRVVMLEMELQARDKELEKSNQQFADEVRQISDDYDHGYVSGNGGFRDEKKREVLSQEIIDAALSSSRQRIIDLQKAHNHLLSRYNALNDSYLALKEHVDQREEDGDDALLSGASYGSAGPFSAKRRGQGESPPEPLSYESGPSNSFPVRQVARIDTGISTGSGQGEGRSPIEQGKIFQAFSPGSVGSGGLGSLDGMVDSGESKGKIKPQSDVRIYGRGGVQNIGKKEKEKKDKGKEKEAQTPDGKKEKKGVGIRGIRGFV